MAGSSDLMKIALEKKVAVLSSVMKPIMDLLAAELPEGDDDLTGDDILDFFALGVAALIDNDSLLTTPRDLRLAVETARKHVDRHVKELRAAHDESGVSLLALMLEPAAPSTPH